jgi:peroxiredoxin Q/BCP
VGVNERRRPSRAAGWLVATLALTACEGAKKTESGAAASSEGVVAEPKTSWRTPRTEPLGVGDEAPDFEGIVHTGASIRLSALLDRPVAVFFYAHDDGETAPALDSIRDRWLDLNGTLSMVLGVSEDPNVVHREFATEHELPFLLVTDSERAIMRAFGVAGERGEPKRSIFLVGTDRKVLRVLDPAEPSRQGEALHEALEDLSG